MAVNVKCPECGETISIAAEHVTWQVKCRWCSHLFVPADEANSEAPGVSVKPAVTWQFCFLPPLVVIVLIIVWVIDLHINPKGSYEAAAIANLRTISSGEELYKTRNGAYCSLADLYALGAYIDQSLSTAVDTANAKGEYYYIFTLSEDGESWCCVAIPARPGRTGSRSFYINQTGAIHWAECKSESETDRPAGPDSKKLGQ